MTPHITCDFNIVMDKNAKQPEKKETKFVISPEIERHIQILSKDPKSPVFAVLSEAYRKGGLLDEAIAVATEGLKHNPNYVSGRVALARAYLDKGELDKAEDEFKKVIKSTPDNIISHRLLADVYIKKSEINLAIQELKTVVFLSPDDKEAKNLLNSITKPAEPVKEKQSAQEEQNKPKNLIQPSKVKEAEITQETNKAEKQTFEKIQTEAPTEAYEEIKQEQPVEPIEPIQPKTEPISEPPELINQPTQPAQTQKDEYVIEQSKQEQEFSVDMQLEQALEEPLIETKEKEAKDKTVETLEHISEAPKEEISLSVPEEEKASVNIETPAEQKIQTESKEQDLEFTFEELVKTTDTSSQEQSALTVEDQAGLQLEQNITTEKVETEKQVTKTPTTEEHIHTLPVQEPKTYESTQTAELAQEDIQTVTMADLYVKQGHLEKAYHIYKTILQKTLDNPIIRAKLIKVKKLIEAKQLDELDKQKFEALKQQEQKMPVEEQSDTMKENMKRLSAWLDKIKKGG